MKLLFTFLVCALFVTTSFSQTVRPSVSVIGEAYISVAPDQVVFTFEVVTVSKDVATAKRDNDLRAAKTLTVAKDFQIAPDDIQTESLTISPQYTGAKDPRGEHVLLGYEVTKRISVTLKNLDKIDSFLSKAIEAGVNRVVAINIGTSRMQEFEEQVKAMAVKNAQEKAQAYAQQLGQTIGKAYVIREEEADMPTFSSGFGSGNGSGDGSDSFEPKTETPKNPFVNPVTFALGEIIVEGKVYVTFELNR